MLRFNQVFTALLALSLFSVVVLPARTTNSLRGIQVLFYPVARPARMIGWKIRHRFEPPPAEVRAAGDVRAENERLRAQVLNLTGQLEALERINQDRNRLGDIRPYCTPFAVIGSDAGTRDSLSIAATTRDGVTERMPVLYAEGIVGWIERVGVAGAQVMLVTDPAFAVRGKFYYFAPGDPKAYPLAGTSPLLKGAGRGRMVILNIPIDQTDLQHDPNTRKLQVGDRVALDDPDWPINLKGRMMGEVESIAPQKSAPLLSEIRVRPIIDLATLREVMVMNK